MCEMGIHATCPKPSLSRKAHGAQVVPYLLRNVEITRPNQAWSIDITYIPMRHGFMYLTAVLEVLRGERQLAEIATELQIQPNLLRAWKADFLDDASMVFDRNRDEDQGKRLESERREKEACQRKIGQLAMQAGWLEKICGIARA